MDNRHDLPGYKYYTRPDGYRPAAHVAFLDLVEPGRSDPVAGANGVCIPVDEPLLEALDARERNYRRIDVSERVAAGGARVWAYIGSTEGRDRLAAGVRIGTAVIDAGYLRLVEQGFGALGGAEQRVARDSLRPGDLPVVELFRHEL
jgi:hypothetical protein